MRRFLLDTNVLVHYARQSPLYKQIEANENLSAADALPIISVVTYGEIISFALQRNWGKQKLQIIQSLLSKLVIIDVSTGDISLLNAYAEIDAYSKGNLSDKPLIGSAIKMGKNDLWIAATAKVADAVLITTDGDFDHLNNEFLTVKKYFSNVQ